MVNDNILQLSILFSEIPLKGLFFWQSLLLPPNVQYDNLIQAEFDKVLNQIPEKNTEQKKYYQDILTLLKNLRKEVINNPAVKKDVENIKNALKVETANDLAMITLINNLKSHT